MTALYRFAGTLEALHGLVFPLRPKGVVPTVGHQCPTNANNAMQLSSGTHGAAGAITAVRCDLRGLTKLRSLSIYADHQAELLLPPSVETLAVTLRANDDCWMGSPVDHRDFCTCFTSNDHDEDCFDPHPWRRWPWPHSTEWFFIVARPGVTASLARSRPTWATFLRSAAGLRELHVEGEDCLGSLCFHLQDFKREWPAGLTLRELTAVRVYLPFDLAVRDAELLKFQEVSLLSTASTAEHVLEVLLAGRARKVWFHGPTLCLDGWPWSMAERGPGTESYRYVNLDEVVKVARSPRYASRIKVEESPWDWGTMLTVVARWR